MTDGVSVVTAGLVRGLQDAVCGVVRIYSLDSQRVVRPAVREPRSTLARRRYDQMAEEERTRPVIAKSEPKVIHRIFRCCAWNGGIFWLSIILFNHVLMPFLQYFTEAVFHGSTNQSVIWQTIGPIIGWTFSALWVLPLFLLSKIVNGLWFQDIADQAYRQSRGRPVLIHSISKMIADVLFSLLLQGLFLIQGTLALCLPIRGVGELVSLVHFSLLYAVYAFEYKWFNMGWEVHRRLAYVENNWPYFVGFGLPLSVLTFLQSTYVMSGCVFSILFPLYIISANEADPINIPCPWPLRLFSPVIKITNVICTKLITSNTATSHDRSTSHDVTSRPDTSDDVTDGSPSRRHHTRARDVTR